MAYTLRAVYTIVVGRVPLDAAHNVNVSSNRAMRRDLWIARVCLDKSISDAQRMIGPAAGAADALRYEPFAQLRGDVGESVNERRAQRF